MVNEFDNYNMIPEQQQPIPNYFNNVLAAQEAEITNIVAQIDPKTIIDNLDHALRGEHYNKERMEWEMNASKQPIVNDACRGSVISYLDGILTNNTTMGNVDEKRLSYMMESVIDTVNRMFTVNLERFGFVPKGERFDECIYENKGTPDSARMTLVSNMIYVVCYMVFSRALKGQESIRIFKSLSMSDQLYGGGQQQQQKQGWLSKLFGR